MQKNYAAIKFSTIRGKFTHFLNCRGTKNYTNNMQSSPPVKQCHHGYLPLFNLALNLLNLSMNPTTNILMINCYRTLMKICHTCLLSTLFGEKICAPFASNNHFSTRLLKNTDENWETKCKCHGTLFRETRRVVSGRSK